MSSSAEMQSTGASEPNGASRLSPGAGTGAGAAAGTTTGGGERAAPPPPALEGRHLVRTFRTGSALRPGRVSALDGVSFSLQPGTTLGVVGESGCGKSTLARIAVGLDQPTSGTLHHDGRLITGAGRGGRQALRGRVQLVFQDPYTSLNPRSRIGDVIAEPLAATGKLTRRGRADRVQELLALVGLPADAAERYPAQFSGGQRQRVGIARALALEPDVLVCDEPVSALDVSVQAQVVNLLADLQHRLGLAMLFIAHDLSVVEHLADEVMVMYLGRVVEQGPSTQVFARPQHPYTQALLSAVPAVDRRERGRLARRRRLQGEPPSPADPPPGCRFNPRCWLATDVCRAQQPALQHHHDAATRAACHHVERALQEVRA